MKNILKNARYDLINVFVYIEAHNLSDLVRNAMKIKTYNVQFLRELSDLTSIPILNISEERVFPNYELSEQISKSIELHHLLIVELAKNGFDYYADTGR